ncbi:MAG: dihydroorotate dehydrogenase-like protein [Bacteroidales bacterium]|nr:dihydroorotate dehydrogenase-like protein [Bacteroidales bacterium]MCF8389139.1 dihydroorotate dehydrogenase-like protein [Bacteroidales bacterium]
MADLSTTYMGLKLKSPLIAASSGLTDNIPNLKRFEEYGVGAVVLKSIFEEEIILEKKALLAKMGSQSFIYPETLEFYDYNDDTENESSYEYLQLVKKAKKELSIPVIASINCITADQWTYFPGELESAGADALELNVFIMPSDLKRGKAETDKVYFDIINQVTSQVSIPVSLKLSFYFSDLAIMLKKFSETPIKGMVLFNRFYNPDIDIDNLEVISSNVFSSKEDLATSLRWIAIMHDHVSCDLAASTGVHDGKAMIKMLLAGASAVEVASAFYNNGVSHAAVMLKELEDWMDLKKYKSINDFKALMSQHETGNPAAFQRVQFMKYFRGQRK